MSRIFVCPLSDLENSLASSRAKWMISLSGPGKSPQRPEQITGGYLALEFNDIDAPRDDLVPPDTAHISQLLAFFAQWNRQGNLLIHCWMGISRSTAAAAIALAALQPDRNPTDIAATLRQSSPMATPNRLMIAHADKALQLDGRLSTAIAGIGRGAEASQGLPFCLEIRS